MPPRVRLGVVHLAPRRAALRARKASTPREIDPQIQTTPPNVELLVHHLPRLLKTKGSLKQVQIVHTGIPRSRINSPTGW
jgi:hypothetical protein